MAYARPSAIAPPRLIVSTCNDKISFTFVSESARYKKSRSGILPGSTRRRKPLKPRARGSPPTINNASSDTHARLSIYLVFNGAKAPARRGISARMFTRLYLPLRPTTPPDSITRLTPQNRPTPQSSRLRKNQRSRVALEKNGNRIAFGNGWQTGVQ